jgi:hypothetical protein
MNNFTANYAQRNQFSNPYYNVNPTSVASATTNNIIWVQGIEGAKAWQLNPNSMVILLDSEVEGKMYIKVSDNIGMSSLRIFNYVEEIPSTNNSVTVNNELDLSQYVRKDELQTLIKEVIGSEQSISGTTDGSVSSNATPAPAKPKVVTVLKK